MGVAWLRLYILGCIGEKCPDSQETLKIACIYLGLSTIEIEEFRMVHRDLS